MFLKKIYDEESLREFKEKLVPIRQEVEATVDRMRREFPNLPSATFDKIKEDLVARKRPRLPKVDHVQVLRAGDRWHLSTRLKKQGEKAGWISTVDGKVSLKTPPGSAPLVYEIVRVPGTYCCHCGEEHASSAEAKDHVEAMHAGVPSPDQNNPAGWETANYYDCRYLTG